MCHAVKTCTGTAAACSKLIELGIGINLRCWRERILGVHLAAKCGDALPGFEIRDARADRLDFPGGLEPRRIGQLRLHRVFSLAEQRIGKVDSGRAHFD
jgi:hypothetical protein